MTTHAPLSREEINNIIFRPLDARNHEVRHVRLHPAATFDDPIVCTLETISLNKNVFFTALSWCWGEANSNGSIILNGHTWMIPSSLEVALRYLRYTEKARTLWIDALCINQSPRKDAITERNHQIQLMKLVFSMAPQVVIWLGIPSDTLASFVQKTILDGGLEPTADYDANAIARAIADLLSLPWWSRLWVVQEAVLGSKVEMQLGIARFIFRFLIDDIYNFYEEHRTQLDYITLQQLELKMGQTLHIFRLLKHQHVRASDIRQTIYDAIDMDSSEISTGTKVDNAFSFPKRLDLLLEETDLYDGPNTLYRLLAACRLREASDAHDKIYGLLGLLSPEAAVVLRPDYLEPVQKMYIRLVSCFIKQDHLTFLCEALPSLRNDLFVDLPTWVPDWSISAPTSSSGASPFRCIEPITTTALQEMRTWCAWIIYRGKEPLISDETGQENSTGPVLVTGGILIDSVLDTTETLPEITNFERWKSHIEPWLCHVSRQSLPAIWDQEPVEHYVQTLAPYDLEGYISPVSRSQSSPNVHSRRNIVSRYLRDKIARDAARGSPTAADLLNPWLRRAGLNAVYHGCRFQETSKRFRLESGQPTTQAASSHLLAKATYNRRLFSTADNHIGNGPHTMKKGDKLFFLPECHLPCILRPVTDSPNTYVFVGECYLEVFEMGEVLTPDQLPDVNLRLSTLFQSLKTVPEVIEAKNKLLLHRYKHIKAFSEIRIL